MLHLPKTGGTALRDVLGPVAPSHGIRLHGHKVHLRDVPEDEGVFFFVREPSARFVSGFNSRLRKGLPRYDIPWSEKEALAFGRFATANHLAEALGSDDHEERRAAERAMTGIRQLRPLYSDWLEDEAYLESRRSSIVLVGRTEHADADFERLKQVLQLPADLKLPRDPVSTHATPPGFDTALSERGRRNVLGWYRRDVELWTYLLRTFIPG
jgi:hypothetical protein